MINPSVDVSDGVAALLTEEFRQVLRTWRSEGTALDVGVDILREHMPAIVVDRTRPLIHELVHTAIDRAAEAERAVSEETSGWEGSDVHPQFGVERGAGCCVGLTGGLADTPA